MKNAKQDGDYEKTLRRAGFQKLTLYKFTILTFFNLLFSYVIH